MHEVLRENATATGGADHIVKKPIEQRECEWVRRVQRDIARRRILRWTFVGAFLGRKCNDEQ